MTDELTRRQKAGAWATARRARQAREVSRGHVAAALAERTTGKPLVVETLEQRLARLLPGAGLHEVKAYAAEDRWEVRVERQVLATGASAREAVDRAVFLWGER